MASLRDTGAQPGSKIVQISARPVLNSVGDIVVEAVVDLENGIRSYASSPAGTTIGQYDSPTVSVDEAFALVPTVNQTLVGLSVLSQREVDDALAQALGTVGDDRIGAANLSAAVSLAACTAAAAARQVPIWVQVAEQFGTTARVPGLVVNVVNGGGHNPTGLSATEVMLVIGAAAPRDMIRTASTAFQWLSREVSSLFGPHAVASGLEGGLTPPFRTCAAAFEMLAACVAELGLQSTTLGVDMAANGLLSDVGGHKYVLDGVSLSSGDLVRLYEEWSNKWPSLTYLEDPFADDDLEPWRNLRAAFGPGSSTQIVADDLTSSSRRRLVSLANSPVSHGVIAKINQCGTLSAMADFVTHARATGQSVIVSQRSRETDSPVLADLAVGFGADYIKAGCCARERIVKYNRMSRIFEDEWERFRP